MAQSKPVTSRQFLDKPQVPLPPASFEPKYQMGNFVPSEMTEKQDYIQRLTADQSTAMGATTYEQEAARQKNEEELGRFYQDYEHQ